MVVPKEHWSDMPRCLVDVGSIPKSQYPFQVSDLTVNIESVFFRGCTVFANNAML